MRVRDVMTVDPIVVPPSTSVLAARRLLARHGIRHLPVVARGQVVGMLSDRDLRVGDRGLRAVLASLQSDLVDGRFRPVANVMTSPVRCIGASAEVAEAARMLREHRISALPVMRGGALVGIVTTTDLLMALGPGEAADRASVVPKWVRVPLGPGPRRPGRPCASDGMPDPTRERADLEATS